MGIKLARSDLDGHFDVSAWLGCSPQLLNRTII